MKFVDEKQLLSMPNETGEDFVKRIQEEKLWVMPDTYDMAKAKAGDRFWFNRVTLYEISQGKSNWILYETTSVHPKAGVVLAERVKDRSIEEVFGASIFDEMYPAEASIEIDPRLMEVKTCFPHQKVIVKHIESKEEQL